MTTEMEKAVQKMEKVTDPAEKAHIRKEIDQMPISSGELDQVMEREADRQANDIKAFREKRDQ